MSHSRIALFIVLLAGCDGSSPTAKDVDALKARIEVLERELAGTRGTMSAQGGRLDTLETDYADLEQVLQMETAIAANTAASADNAAILAAAEHTLAAAAALLAYVSVDTNGDVVVEGANLTVRSGSGSTDGEINGKGNLFVGYNERERVGGVCEGGSNPGTSCIRQGQCFDGGFCNFTIGIERTGSHNLIVGHSHSYSSYGAILGGVENTASATHVSILGGSFNIANTHGATVGGGHENKSSGRGSTVAGGFQNEATGQAELVP